MPSFLDTFRRDARPGLSSFWANQEPPEDETPFERWKRENRERMEAAGALPTEEMPALQTAGAGTGAAGVGRDILSGTLGLGANLTGLYNQPFRALEPLLGRSPVGQAQDWLQEQARGFQETPDPSWMPGEGAPRGAYSEALIESSVAAGNEPWEAAVADTARATLGLADPMDLTPAGAAGALGAFLQRFLRKGGDEVAPAAGRAVRKAGEGLADEFSAWRGLGAPERSEIARIETKADDVGPQRELIAYDAEGNRVGDFEFFEEAEELRPFIVTTTGKGTGVGRRLYREAVERYGKPIGESMARSDEGEGFRRRLMETDPDLFAPRRALDASGPQAAPEVPQAAATPQQPLDELPRASTSRLPFQTNFRERLSLDQDAGDALEEILLKDLDSVQAQRRAGGPSLAEKKEAVERIAAANGMTPRKFMETKPGTVYNDEEMMVLDSMIARRGDDVRDLSRQLEAARQSNLGDVDRLQLEMGRAIYEQNALLKVSIGSSSEAGRALRSRQEIVRAIKKCFPMG